MGSTRRRGGDIDEIVRSLFQRDWRRLAEAVLEPHGDFSFPEAQHGGVRPVGAHVAFGGDEAHPAEMHGVVVDGDRAPARRDVGVDSSRRCVLVREPK